MRARNPVLAILALLLLAGGVYAVRQARQSDVPPALPAVTPVGGVTLVAARPFTLEVPYVHEYRAERPSVSAGAVLVLSVDPELVHPRQTAEPVLYVGDQTAERLNVGHESGHLVVIVPAPVDARGRVALDLTTTPIFFGAPALPEQVDAATVAKELAAARARGIAPPTAQVVAAATQSQVRFHDDYDVHVWAADLIEAWSPMEVDLVSGLRAPRLGK
jgi:hypothetical protein